GVRMGTASSIPCVVARAGGGGIGPGGPADPRAISLLIVSRRRQAVGQPVRRWWAVRLVPKGASPLVTMASPGSTRATLDLVTCSRRARVGDPTSHREVDLPSGLATEPWALTVNQSAHTGPDDLVFLGCRRRCR